jgi:hypothetical protein
MAKDNFKESRGGKRVAPVAIRRFYIHMTLLLVLFLAIVVGALWVFLEKQSRDQPPPTPVAKVANQLGNRFDRLKGRWVRPDGGYILEIREVAADGKMTVGYFNPLPINVFWAEAADDGKDIKVFIELRDVNYPGATYNLVFNPEDDQLRGIYMQPAMRQSFQIFFVREN